jgi:hypothetical protein
MGDPLFVAASIMLQMLISEMGGLLDRQVYYMPFSRTLKVREAEVNAIGSIC